MCYLKHSLESYLNHHYSAHVFIDKRTAFTRRLSMESLFTGLTMGLSLIVAIGAQNIWVLSQSMRSEHRFTIASVCILCDVGLIILGVFFAVKIQAYLPSLLPVFVWGGVLFLSWLAYQALYRVYKGQYQLSISSSSDQNRLQIAAAAFSISLLNPHVYLDTVILLGNIGGMQERPNVFALGAALASVFWFSVLTYFAPKLKIWLNSPLRWRVFDCFIAAFLILIAIKLLDVL